MRLGLALSGGGVRATAFHLGVLARLAAGGELESVAHVSTVSGGSLAVGLVIAEAEYQWPTSADYLERVLPRAQAVLTTTGLQGAYVKRVIGKPSCWGRGRAYELAEMLRTKWGIGGTLADLPETPLWAINATTYETGKCWRFRRERMGDYKVQYVERPRFPLAQALAASAAVPGLIGPLTIVCQDHEWHAFARPDGPYAAEPNEELVPTVAPYKKLRLWDGGVYDNLGTEPLFKEGRGLRGDVDFLLVSDASRPLLPETRRFRLGFPDFYTPPFRLVDIATDQVRGLRARTLVSHFAGNPGTGAFLRLGNTRDRIYREARRDIPACEALVSDEDCARALDFPTVLRRLTPGEFRTLVRHGYDVGDATLGAYCPDEFALADLPGALRN